MGGVGEIPQQNNNSHQMVQHRIFEQSHYQNKAPRIIVCIRNTCSCTVHQFMSKCILVGSPWTYILYERGWGGGRGCFLFLNIDRFFVFSIVRVCSDVSCFSYSCWCVQYVPRSFMFRVFRIVFSFGFPNIILYIQQIIKKV